MMPVTETQPDSHVWTGYAGCDTDTPVQDDEQALYDCLAKMVVFGECDADSFSVNVRACAILLYPNVETLLATRKAYVQATAVTNNEIEEALAWLDAKARENDSLSEDPAGTW